MVQFARIDAWEATRAPWAPPVVVSLQESLAKRARVHQRVVKAGARQATPFPILAPDGSLPEELQ